MKCSEKSGILPLHDYFTPGDWPYMPLGSHVILPAICVYFCLSDLCVYLCELYFSASSVRY